MTMADNKCEVCDERPPVAVACVPGMPMSVAYCRECAEAGASPYWAIVMNTAIIGGMDHAAPWWEVEVQHTLKHLKKTREQFDEDVAVEIVRQREDEAKYFAEQEAKDRAEFEAELKAEGVSEDSFARDDGGYLIPYVAHRWGDFLNNRGVMDWDDVPA